MSSLYGNESFVAAKCCHLYFGRFLYNFVPSVTLLSLLDTKNGYEEQQKEPALEEQGQVRPFLEEDGQVEEDGRGKQGEGEGQEILHRRFHAVLRVPLTGGAEDSFQSFRKSRPGPLLPEHGRRVSLQIHVSWPRQSQQRIQDLCGLRSQKNQS